MHKKTRCSRKLLSSFSFCVSTFPAQSQLSIWWCILQIFRVRIGT